MWCHELWFSMMSMKSRFCSIQVLLFLTMFSCLVFSSLKTMKWFSFATMLICQKSFVLVWWEGKTRLWQQQWRNNRWFWMISRWWTWPILHFLHQGNEVLQCTLQCIQWQLTQAWLKPNASFCDEKDRKKSQTKRIIPSQICLWKQSNKQLSHFSLSFEWIGKKIMERKGHKDRTCHMLSSWATTLLNAMKESK